MKKTITTLLLLATLVGTAHAQVRKCILPDGKVTYSDVLCNKYWYSVISVVNMLFFIIF